MMKISEAKLTLGLETGIDGGGVALLRGEEVLCSARGAGDLSKSEDLLLLVKKLLAQSGLSKDDIGYIAVSEAPGSATGIRIGLATAAGLKDSLMAEIIKICVLHAQVLLSGVKDSVISALYSEKSGIYYVRFRFINGEYLAETEILNNREVSDFGKMLSVEDKFLVMDQKLALQLSSIPETKLALQQFEIQINQRTLAETIGLAANIIVRPIT